ncbi:ATP-binding cassette domain-containing protein [Streptomyces gamaensis]|uniref:ATP-binding cassette domain-containing protein n=1 Tax=Streptomyces gamaensis TaxID=1763542 RepID=A0ABW0YW27_9ACTN
MPFPGRKRTPAQPPISDSERLLFSGVLRHDKAWAQYEDPLLRMSFWVSLTIPVGKVVALVGENGSGKTTLAEVLAGLYLPTVGTVSYNGVEVREADRESVFDKVALLPQDVQAWTMTVRANIHIGDVDKPLVQEHVEAAAERADVRDIVEELPHGWDSIALKGFERGVRLSGGQWQRVGAARALYRDRTLVIVDEPTAALDAKAEIEMLASLRSLTDDGVEHGDHHDLMGIKQGHYRELYELQVAQYAASDAALPAQRGACTCMKDYRTRG